MRPLPFLLLALLAAGTVTAAPPPSDLWKQFPIAAQDAYSQRHPSARADVVVWADDRDFDQPLANEHEIYLYNLTTGETKRLTHFTSSKTYPRYSQGWVVWGDNRNGNQDVYALNLATNQETRVTTSSKDQTSPDFDYPWVVYQDNTDGNEKLDVWAYNLATREARKLTPSDRRQITPAIDGRLVAWVDVLSLGEGAGVVADSDVWGYDLETRESRRITDEAQEQSNADVDYPYVVWQDGRTGSLGWDLYAYNWQTKEELTLVRHDHEQSRPQIQWPHLVWMDLRDHTTSTQGHTIYYRNVQTGDQRRLSEPGAGADNPGLADRFVAWTEQDESFDVWGMRILRADASVPTAPTSGGLTSESEDAGRGSPGPGPWLALLALAGLAVLRRRA